MPETSVKTLTEQLTQYAAYHRDRRNIVTHFVGIPLIVVAVAILLSRPVLMVGGVPLSAAVVVVLLSVAFYLALDIGLGLVMGALMALALMLGAWAAAQSTATWLTLGVGGFIVGWVLQFIGHIYEGRKPAFVDDIVGLLIGPLFVLAEALFAFGIKRELQERIEAVVGPTRASRPTTPA